MKRLVTWVIIFTVLFCTPGCGQEQLPEADGQESSTFQITATPETEVESGVEYEILSSRANVWTELEGTEYEYKQINVIVELLNTGTSDLHLSTSTYDLEDTQGNLVSAQDFIFAFPEILAPGEIGYLAITNDFDRPFEGELVVKPRVVAEKSQFSCIRYDVTDLVQTTSEYGSVISIGRVENTQQTTEDRTYVFVAYYDENGTCIETDYIFVDKLAPGEKVGFETVGFLSPDVTPDKIARTVCYAYPSQYHE